MARIAGIDIPDNKRGEIALTYVYGIGLSSSRAILRSANVDLNTRTADWNEEELSRVRSIITTAYKVEGVLRSEMQLSIKRLLDIGCYRGLRHRKGLPVRGQKTKNNCRTRKGKSKTVAGKRKVTK